MKRKHALTAREVADLLPVVLTMPAPDGVRVVALHWLHTVLGARQAWQRARDADAQAARGHPSSETAEALHKVRVGLRRLRSTLREHDKPLALHIPRAMRRSLHRLSAGTNDSRDRDVQRGWLHSHTDMLLGDARLEAEALETRMAAGARGRAARVARLFARHLDANAGSWLQTLSHYQCTVHVGHHTPPTSFAAHLASTLERGIAAITVDLEGLRGGDDLPSLHRLRLKLKRQRAMLSLFVDRDPALAAWYTMATAGQDALGAMRDASLLAERAGNDDCQTLAAVASTQAQARLREFRSAWVARQEETLRCAHEAVDAMARLAAAPVSPASMPDSEAGATDDDADVIDARHPHGLPMEIERKFLLHGLPARAAMATALRIEQGWLPGTVLRERLRRTTSADGTVRHTRTIKLGQMGARIEVEEPTDQALFDALWPLTEKARIRKRRHLVTEGDLTWEIDVFLDRDLVLAEIELRDTAQVVNFPSWLAPFVVRDVTLDPAYLNSVMAQHSGAPESAHGPRDQD